MLQLTGTTGDKRCSSLRTGIVNELGFGVAVV